MISAEALKSLDVPVPSLERQRQIVTLATLAEREQALLQEISQARHRLVTQILTQYAREPAP
jgi:restriction endonuclease S subunit